MFSVSLLLFFTSQLICVLSSVPVNDVKHIGCYYASFLKSYSQVGIIIEPFTRDSCVNLCLNELTVYAGLFPSHHQPSLGSGTKFECICTNDIAEFSTRMNDSKCCPDYSGYCGVNSNYHSTISLYQLTPSKSPPTAVIIATEHSLQRLVLGAVPQVTTLHTLPEGVTSIAYRDDNHFLMVNYSVPIFYALRNQIFMLRYNAISMRYADPKLLLEVDCNILDLAYSGVEDQGLVFVCSTKVYATSDIYHHRFDSLTLLFEEKDNNSVFRYIDYDSFGLNVYCDRNTTLDVSRWDKKDWTVVGTDILKDYGFAVMQFAADKQKETLYIIGSFIGSTKVHLVTINYPLTSFKVVYSGPELSNAFKLDVFSGEVIWGSGNANNYTLYRGVMSSKYVLENIEAIHTGTEKIIDMKIYNSDIRYLHEYAVKMCREKECSHRCSRAVRRNVMVCACPDTMVLDDDGKTCVFSNATSTTTTTLAPPTSDPDSNSE